MYEIEIQDVRFFTNAMIIDWVCNNIGWGELTIVKNEEEDKYEIDSECMSDEFVKEVLLKTIDYIFATN